MTEHSTTDNEVSQQTNWFPFLTDSLPEKLRNFVEMQAEAIGCDPALVAMPALVACAGAIGMTRTIRLKHSWSEPAILWGITIARSGSMKSPAFDAAVRPLNHEDVKAEREYKDSLTISPLDR